VKRKPTTPTPPPDRALRCALYARISPTNERVKESGKYKNYSIASQLHEMTEFAEKQGWHTDESLHFIDNGVSGVFLDRPDLNRLRELVRARAIDVVLCLDATRWTRGGLAHEMLLRDECERHGVALRFVGESPDESPEGKMFQNFKSVISEYERLKFKERTTRGRRQKAREGFVHSVGKRFGYVYLGKAQGSKGELRIDAAQAKVVRCIYDEYLRGKRLYQIRAGLNRDGVKSARGGLWSRPVIHQILTNPMYMGQMRGPGGIPVKCPAIISEETFARVQALLMRNKTATVGRPTRRYLLTARLWCALCGRRCTTATGHNKSGVYYYRCANVCHKTHVRGCPALGVRQSHIEDAVWEETWAAITDPETLYGLIAAYRASFATGNAGENAARAKLDRLRRRQQRAIENLYDPDVPPAEAKRRLQEITAEIATIEQEAKRAEVFQMPAKRAIEALAREIAAEEPESFEDRCGVLERLQILVRYDSRTREAEIEGRFTLPGQKNCRNCVGSDAECQCQHGGEREPGTLPECAQRVLEILE
jgi:site-specific DNA recombinase